MDSTIDSKHTHYESECESELEKDDNTVLASRYAKYVRKQLGNSLKAKKASNKDLRVKAHWTRIYDAIQEHFSSHVNINHTSHLLPPNIYAMKQSAKQSWLLYKKRECERRKRLRLKIEAEKEKERLGQEPANILLSMVDSCECCKKLYVTVNLFWGVTLCDICYFNTEVISEIMRRKSETMNAITTASSNISKRTLTSDIITSSSQSISKEEDEKRTQMVKKYYTVNSKKASSTTTPPRQTSQQLSQSLSPVIVEVEEDDDIRPVSTYTKKEEEQPTPNRLQELVDYCNIFEEMEADNSNSNSSQFNLFGKDEAIEDFDFE